MNVKRYYQEVVRVQNCTVVLQHFSVIKDIKQTTMKPACPAVSVSSMNSMTTLRRASHPRSSWVAHGFSAPSTARRQRPAPCGTSSSMSCWAAVALRPTFPNDHYYPPPQPQRYFGTSATVPAIEPNPSETTEDDDAKRLPIVIPTAGVPIHLYADALEPDALRQVRVLAESPIPVDFVAVMPDAHLGVSWFGFVVFCIYE